VTKYYEHVGIQNIDDISNGHHKAQTDYLINMAYIIGKGKACIDITPPYGLCVYK
jgi:hypothetical protein